MGRAGWLAELARGRLEPGSALPFERVLRAQVRLVRVGFLRRRGFPVELELLDRFLVRLGISDPARAETARRERCLASWIRRVRSHYAALPAERQSVWLPLPAGLAAALGKGALLVATHFGGGLLTPLALSRIGIPILVIVHIPGSPMLLPNGFEIVDLSRESTLRAVARARARLLQGGIVFLAGDLASGSRDGDVAVEVLGRTRWISRGFAELALVAGVAPTPVFSRVVEDGRILTWLDPALAMSGATHRERVASLAQAYAARLSETFARHPGNVSPPAIRRYLADAPAGGAAGGAAKS